MQPHDLRTFDHVHPAATGAILSATLPFDHLMNFVWSVAASVVSWGVARLLVWAWQRTKK